ncbi:MAG: preprotein translocase subunit SecE [Caldiserica bacterium]|jgi:preprotein translocase subunit SecE|nr:preprotein translocase subunit SecE [Caldisericota bacterium]MDH7563005.1 preprotein translocase subunit SecE [Caldisericota bacterium]
MPEKRKLTERIKEYFRNVVAELKRVSWPTRKAIVNSTATVLIFVVFWAVFIGLWDYLFAFLMKTFLTGPVP